MGTKSFIIDSRAHLRTCAVTVVSTTMKSRAPTAEDTAMSYFGSMAPKSPAARKAMRRSRFWHHLRSWA